MTQSLRSTGVLAGLLIAAVNIWLALSARTHGFNLWPDLVTGLSAGSLYTGTLAAGFAAFEASRWTTAMTYRFRSGPRTPVLLRMFHASTVIAPIIAGHVVSLLVLVGYAAFSGAYGSPYGWWLVALAAALTAAAAFGYAVGSVGAGRWWVAPAAALAFYGLFVLIRIVPSPYGFKSLFPVITATDSVFVRHLPLTMIAQTVLFVSFAAALVLFVGGGWRQHIQKRLSALAICSALIMVVGASGVLATNGQYTTGQNPRDFTCTEGHFTLCLNRGYAAAATPLRRAFEELAARSAGTTLEPHRLEQNVEGIGDNPSAGARSVYVEQLGPDDMQFAAFRYVQKYGGMNRCQALDDQSALAEQYVDSWLSGYDVIQQGAPGFDRFEQLKAMSTVQGNEWFKANEHEYMKCQLTLTDLP